MKKVLTLLLALILTLPVCNISANNIKDDSIKSIEYHNSSDETSDDSDDNTITYEYCSPYAKFSRNKTNSSTYTNKTYKAKAVSKADAVKQMRNMLKKRYSSFTITFREYNYDYSTIMDEMLKMAYSHTGVPDEGDYIRWNISHVSGGGKCNYVGGCYIVTLTYYIDYYATQAQEAQVTNEINKFFKTYNLNKLTDYEKAYFIYNYICTSVVYDYDDSADMLKHSTYAAMCKKKAVCQGYASLLYRMLLTAGVNNRFICGEAGGGCHAWNIVGIKQSNGKTLYYSCDSTWDAQAKAYKYFLCGSSNQSFYDHVGYAEYNTSNFHNVYPMSTYSFDGAILNNTRYLDVDKTDWYYDVVNKVSDLNIMGPAGDYAKLFAPDNNITRGMVAVVLYRIAGAPKVTYWKRFSDVKSNMWYSNAIIWASNMGIINGYGNGLFAPDDPITREQLAVMMRNFAKMRGKNTNVYHYLGSFVDYKNITSYAKSAMQWAVSRNIIAGSKTSKGTYLNPTKKATRGECAKMFNIFYNLVR